MMDKKFNYILALFMEKQRGDWTISVGRISWWLTFAPALKIWFDGSDVQPNHLAILTMLLGYNLGKHVLNKVQQKLSQQESDGPG
jgi:hypothetical protein